MADLCRIKNNVDLALSDDFLTAEDPRSNIEIDSANDTEIVRGDIDIESIDKLIESAMNSSKSTASDRAIAIDLHRLLPLTRRQAADRRLWAWLGSVQHPHYVAWRWNPARSGLRSPERFIGNRVRQTHARLWWAAELTREGDSDYSLTEQLLRLDGFQDIYEAIFGRAFCQYRPAIQSFINIAGTADEKIIREAAKEFGYILTTLVLETLSKEDIDHMLSDILEKVQARVS